MRRATTARTIVKNPITRSANTAVATAIRGSSPASNRASPHASQPREDVLLTAPATAPKSIGSMTSKGPEASASSDGSGDGALVDAKLRVRRSSERGHSDHGWLNTYHTFSFADYWDAQHTSFGSLRVLNEDRVAPHRGFPTHPHRDAEIFSYILSGELTHRDSMVKQGHEAGTGVGRDDFYRMRRGDVQFTTGGTGIAHSEQNEADGWVHFLQIWALPWKRGLTPRYHTKTFREDDKRRNFVPILSPLRAGPGASESQEAEAKPSIDGTIPIHADLIFAASVLPPGERREWAVGASGLGQDAVKKLRERRAYLHLAMTGGSNGTARVKVNQSDELGEGDGMYIENLKLGDRIAFESVGSSDAEVVLLDSD